MQSFDFENIMYEYYEYMNIMKNIYIIYKYIMSYSVHRFSVGS